MNGCKQTEHCVWKLSQLAGVGQPFFPTFFLAPLLKYLIHQFSHSVVSNSLQPHGLQHARPPCPSPTTRVYTNSCPLSRQSHPTISSSAVPFSSRLQSFPASGSFQMSQFFASCGQRSFGKAGNILGTLKGPFRAQLCACTCEQSHIHTRPKKAKSSHFSLTPLLCTNKR